MNNEIEKSINLLDAQHAALTAMVRALYSAHPDQDQVDVYFDQLLAQMQASEHFLTPPEEAARLKGMAALLKRRPQSPEALGL